MDDEEIGAPHVPAEYERDRVAWNLPLPREILRPEVLRPSSSSDEREPADEHVEHDETTSLESAA